MLVRIFVCRALAKPLHIEAQSQAFDHVNNDISQWGFRDTCGPGIAGFGTRWHPLVGPALPSSI